MYKSKCWALNNNDEVKIKVAEIKKIRWICDVNRLEIYLEMSVYIYIYPMYICTYKYTHKRVSVRVTNIMKKLRIEWKWRNSQEDILNKSRGKPKKG